MKIDARERVRKKVAAVKTPENRPGLARENAWPEEHRARGVKAAGIVLANSMHALRARPPPEEPDQSLLCRKEHRLIRGRASGSRHHPAKLGQWNRTWMMLRFSESQELADQIAERLNEQAQREEQDRWSA
ncbi:hypothetical protein ABIF63_005257 [Bradyrhizobium japonicum]|uniref:Transposase n=1 Tax=Bradyrhizobium japonicum TaxID=375 RepID=A0ABV2RW72_BRAJP|nr:hypothetical protein [Bradyrhizobium japonicum]UQE03248.1 hypothetical protein JEY30_29280 [Bradyrhizobium japonicum]WLB22993.1 hypothetical protein QIH95_19915 [Bradyrhizobium japonicum]